MNKKFIFKQVNSQIQETGSYVEVIQYGLFSTFLTKSLLVPVDLRAKLLKDYESKLLTDADKIKKVLVDLYKDVFKINVQKGSNSGLVITLRKKDKRK